MALTYPLINGEKFDWSSVEVELAGGIFKGVQELTYSDTLEPGIVRGTGPEKLARTKGEYDAEGSLVMFKKDFAEFLRLLTGNGATGYLDTVFGIVASYSAPAGDGTETDVLVGCRITNPEGGGSQGTDPLVETAALDIIRVERSGMLPITNMLT